MRRAGAMKQADCDKAAEQADQARQHHKPQIVLTGQARKNTEHQDADPSPCAKNLADWGFISRYADGTKLTQPSRRLNQAWIKMAAGRSKPAAPGYWR